MKFKRLLLGIGAILTVLSVSAPPTFAYDEAACGIYLCLPAGFPSGCGAQKSEFKHRLKKGRSPLPSWSSCIAPGTPPTDEPYSIQYGYYVYENFGNNVTKRRSPAFGLGSSRREYTNGKIIEETRTCRRTTYTQIGVYALGWSVSNSLNDYVHFEWNTGLPIEEVRKPFTRKVIRTINHGNGQCR